MQIAHLPTLVQSLQNHNLA